MQSRRRLLISLTFVRNDVDYIYVYTYTCTNNIRAHYAVTSEMRVDKGAARVHASRLIQPTAMISGNLNAIIESQTKKKKKGEKVPRRKRKRNNLADQITDDEKKNERRGWEEERANAARGWLTSVLG